MLWLWPKGVRRLCCDVGSAIVLGVREDEVMSMASVYNSRSKYNERALSRSSAPTSCMRQTRSFELESLPVADHHAITESGRVPRLAFIEPSATPACPSQLYLRGNSTRFCGVVVITFRLHCCIAKWTEKVAICRLNSNQLPITSANDSKRSLPEPVFIIFTCPLELPRKTFRSSRKIS